MAAVLSLAAVMLRAAIEPLVGTTHEFAPAYAAVLVATWLATWRAGVLTAILCAASGEVFGAATRFEETAVHDPIAYGMYAIMAGVIIVAMHRAQRAPTSQQGDAARSEVVAAVAHELRNPISAALSALELLKHPDPRMHTTALDTVHRQLGYMKRIVCDLFDRARMEQGTIELRREIVDVDRIVQEAVGDAEVWTAARRQTILRPQPGGGGKMLADPVRIHQALLNLLHNASKFSGEGSVIAVQVSESPDSVCFSVRDSGVGMTAAETAAVFDPYVQAGSTQQREQGLGLGLALTRRLVQLHGGTIDARSRGPGLGSEFTIRLPRGGTEPASGPRGDLSQSTRQACPAADRAKRLPLRLLVVDDNPDAAETLAELLRMKGHEAATALNGRAAIEAAARQAPDLVFLDIALPDMSGHEVAKALREADRGTTIVALSGYPREAGQRGAGVAEFDRYLTKPVTVDDIDAALELRVRSGGGGGGHPPSPPAPPRAPAARGACAGSRHAARQTGDCTKRTSVCADATPIPGASRRSAARSSPVRAKRQGNS